jgi:hypothetical protein
MKFNSQKANEIVTQIRAGVYPQVAAEAAGVHREAFLEWVRRGEKPRASRVYRDFADDVRQASAAARASAEIELRAKDPRFWLKHGPGRETFDYPGWAAEVKPADLRDPHALPPLDGPEWNALCFKMLSALAGFPDARQALAEMLKQISQSSTIHSGQIPH